MSLKQEYYLGTPSTTTKTPSPPPCSRGGLTEFSSPWAPEERCTPTAPMSFTSPRLASKSSIPPALAMPSLAPWPCSGPPALRSPAPCASPAQPVRSPAPRRVPRLLCPEKRKSRRCSAGQVVRHVSHDHT